jgi:hypothetical protein
MPGKRKENTANPAHAAPWTTKGASEREQREGEGSIPDIIAALTPKRDLHRTSHAPLRHGEEIPSKENLDWRPTGFPNGTSGGIMSRTAPSQARTVRYRTKDLIAEAKPAMIARSAVESGEVAHMQCAAY